RTADVATLAQQADTGLREARNLRGPQSQVAQVVDGRGRVIDATPGLTGYSLLRPTQLRGVHDTPVFFKRTLDGQHLRLLATPLRAQGKRVVIVVGASLAGNAAVLADLRQQLLIGGPLALLLASLAGYLLAAAALRPV